MAGKSVGFITAPSPFSTSARSGQWPWACQLGDGPGCTFTGVKNVSVCIDITYKSCTLYTVIHDIYIYILHECVRMHHYHQLWMVLEIPRMDQDGRSASRFGASPPASLLVSETPPPSPHPSAFPPGNQVQVMLRTSHNFGSFGFNMVQLMERITTSWRAWLN